MHRQGCLLDIWTQCRHPHCVPYQAGQAVGTGHAWGERKLAAWGLDEGPRSPGEELEPDSFKQRSDRTHLFYSKDQSTARSVDCIQERKHGTHVGGQAAATGTWNRCWQWRGRSVDRCILETVDVRCENGGVAGLNTPAGGAACTCDQSEFTGTGGCGSHSVVASMATPRCLKMPRSHNQHARARLCSPAGLVKAGPVAAAMARASPPTPLTHSSPRGTHLHPQPQCSLT